MDAHTNLGNSRNHLALWENEKTDGKRKTNVPVQGGPMGTEFGKLDGKFHYVTEFNNKNTRLPLRQVY